MSKNKVKFTIPNRRLTYDLLILLDDVFGENYFNDVHCETREDLEIICKPKQFAKFLIERNNRNLPNMFKELEPKFLEKSKKIVDVSKQCKKFTNNSD